MGMTRPGSKTVNSLVRVLWAALRAPREPLTLEQLRSDLSHEAASKFARLSGFIEEWRRGHLQPEDGPDVGMLLRDLERLHLRYAWLAVGRPGSLLQLVRLLTATTSARARVRSSRLHPAPSAGALDAWTRWHAAVVSNSRGLVEKLSARYGIRVGTLAVAAAEEVRRETGNGSARQPGVTVDDAGAGSSTWVPRSEATRWLDVFRNLVRNGVQATREERTRGPQAVTVRLRARSAPPGTTVEVLDAGIGMSADRVDSMWRTGGSTHGTGRGNGLTEAKRAFIESRAELEVRSSPGVGTCVRIDMLNRAIPIRAPHLWPLQPILAASSVIAATVIFTASAFVQSHIETVEVEGERHLRALDAQGELLWQRDLGVRVLVNYLGSAGAPRYLWPNLGRPVLLQGRWPWEQGIIVATQPEQGPGAVWRLDAHGRKRWAQPLGWNPPRNVHTGNLQCIFEAPIPWCDGKQALALNVRDGNYSATAIQFMSASGELLGEYDHPGHLEFLAAEDIDGDGAVELLLSGINNDMRADTTFLATDPGVYIDCLLMLHPPRISGQAYPYRAWANVPAAHEEGYLLIPPIRPGVRPLVEGVRLGKPTDHEAARIELIVRDGRILHLDARLRPLSCGVGDNTLASSLAPTRAMGPCLYLHDGRHEPIDLDVAVGRDRP